MRARLCFDLGLRNTNTGPADDDDDLCCSCCSWYFADIGETEGGGEDGNDDDVNDDDDGAVATSIIELRFLFCADLCIFGLMIPAVDDKKCYVKEYIYI